MRSFYWRRCCTMVGKAIDPADHVTAGLQALEGTITARTEFLIAHHMEAHAGARMARSVIAPGNDLSRRKTSTI